MRCRWLALLIVVLTGLFAHPVQAQEAAQEDVLRLKPGVGRAGTGFYETEQWNLVRSTAVNTGSTEQQPLLAISVAGTNDVQFAKRLWLPPRSELVTLTPVRLTGLKPGSERGVEAEARFIIEVNGREIATKPDIGVLPVRQGGFETAVMASGDDRTVQVSTALRESAGLQPTTAYVGDHDSPQIAAAWDNIDALVFSRGEANLSTAQIESIRRWLVGGGRLWINLQRVSPDFVRRLLGNEWKLAVIDRVPVHEFTIQTVGDAKGDRGVTVKRDYPLELVRVFAPDMQVLHTVDGYPASLRATVGMGQLLVTTLEAPAWLGDDGKANEALKGLTWFVRPSESVEASEKDSAADVLTGIASQQIGYRVMGRGPVLAVLGLFTAALLVGGLFLARGDNLAHLGWVAPVLAAAAAVVLLAMGIFRQSEVPFTAASAEMVEAIPGQPYAKVTSLLSVYTPPGADRETAQLQGGGPVAWPDLNAGSGATVRLVWHGDYAWRYSNLPLREGAVLTSHVNAVLPLDKPAVAAVRFTEDGIAGVTQASGVGELSDAVVVTPNGKLTPKMGEGGAFEAAATDTLGPDQFYTGGVLGQREMARQAVYRDLMKTPDFPAQPSLVGWSEGIDLGVSVSAEADAPREALVVLPLVIESAAPGAKVSIPAAFLTMRPYREDKRFMSAPIYDERNRQWVENVNTAQTVLMKFQMPGAVRSLELSSARFVFDLVSPGRPYEVVVYRKGQVVSAQASENAAGESAIELTGDVLPDVREDGSVVVGVRVGEPTDPLANQPWSIRRLELSLTGTVK